MNDQFTVKEKYPRVECCKTVSGDIVFAEFPDGIIIDLAAAREIVANRLDFTGNEKHYLIVDISNVKQVSSGAKEYLQRQETGLMNLLGAAFLASNPVSAMIANIFIKTPKNFHAKFFSNKKDAFEWIVKQKQTLI